ncbi:FtsB family cell division protein [Serinibacter arcticus]|uniref:FtsB family cell division protein n=1 Tax=Serinibacter arcticus TaxID=1655435 RepID=UPI0010931B99|nr:septum formation initiator family protein [Serinibacter arcticus]
MSARPAAARVASARAGTAPRATSRPAGRGGAASRGGAGSRAGSTSSGGSAGAARGRGGRVGGGRGGSGGGRGRGGGEPGEPRQITLRTAGFALVLLVAFIVLAPTLRAYVTQQEQLRDVNAALAETNARAEALQAELTRWSDPDYVKSQAADRFGLVAPGETAYSVTDPETVTGEDPMGDLRAQDQASSPYASTATPPWYATVWTSVEVAGAAQEAAADPEPEAPATTPVPGAPAETPAPDAGPAADGATG